MIEQVIVDVYWDQDLDGHDIMDHRHRNKVQAVIDEWNAKLYEVTPGWRPVYKVEGTQLLFTKRS